MSGREEEKRGKRTEWGGEKERTKYRTRAKLGGGEDQKRRATHCE